MTEEEFRELIDMPKKFMDSNILLPEQGAKTLLDVTSKTTEDNFFVDLSRYGRIELSKKKAQTRHQQTGLALVRIDINGAEHMNPDHTKVSGNHFHIYKPIKGDNGNLPWAYELNEIGIFKDITSASSFEEIFNTFCRYCNIDLT